MKVSNISPFEGDHINVIVETPLGSRIKYAYDPQLDVMTMKHQLPYGYFFAFNFGFIPNTQAEDGMHQWRFDGMPGCGGPIGEAKKKWEDNTQRQNCRCSCRSENL